MPGHDPDWKHKFNQRMMMKRMGIDPDKNNIAINNEKKEPTEEEKAEMERKRKDEGEKRRIARIKSLEKSISAKAVLIKVQEKAIARMKAERDVLERIGLPEERNEWKRRSVQAEIEYMEVEAEHAGYSYHRAKEELESMEAELAGLRKNGEKE